MPAYVRLQAREFALESEGYTATRHQREAGTGYFDDLLLAVTGGSSSTSALAGSTEAEQFHDAAPAPAAAGRRDAAVHDRPTEAEGQRPAA
jgi:hypothetical protein